MSSRTVVVDGSNIATEGRQMPSLIQLDEAVRAFREEHPDDEIIVVVDATFAHRIPDEERPLFEEAAAHNELVYPPAGAIGRGDAFLLRIAEKTAAVVLSNDSFQEFHGEHEWLFDKGRLIGGTPVPGVGWIFVPRTPVRGPKSREAVKEAKRGRARVGSKDASRPMPVPKAPPPRKQKVEPAAQAIAEATDEVVGVDVVDEAGGAGRRRRRRRRGRGGGAGNGAAASLLPTLNEPLVFIEFIADHKLGSSVRGVVESFSSHGAFVTVGEARCYIPLSAMGEPPPRSAKEVLHKGEEREFIVQALDAPRRGIELALPGFEHISGAPTEETVEAEVTEAPRAARKRAPKKAAAAKAGAAKRAGAEKAGAREAVEVTPPEPEPVAAPAKKAASKKAAAAAKAPAAKQAPRVKKAAAEKAAPKKTAATKKAPAVKTAAATKTAAPKKAAATKKVAARTAAATKAPATKAPAVKKAAAKKAPAVKKAPAKKAPAKKAPAKKA